MIDIRPLTGVDFETMTASVQQFNTIRAELGLPPDQPTTLLWMYCAESSSEAEEGWEYFHNQLTAALHWVIGNFDKISWDTQVSANLTEEMGNRHDSPDGSVYIPPR